VQQGNLNPKYKTTLCQAFAATGRQERTRPGWGWHAWGVPVRVHCRDSGHAHPRPATPYQSKPQGLTHPRDVLHGVFPSAACMETGAPLPTESTI